MTEHTQYEELVQAETKLAMVHQLVNEIGGLDSVTNLISTRALEEHIACVQSWIAKDKADLRERLEQHSTI